MPTSIHGLQALGRASAQTDLGAMLNLDELLVQEHRRDDAHERHLLGLLFGILFHLGALARDFGFVDLALAFHRQPRAGAHG